LSYYQLWADDLFKKARFRDTLQIIEKLGHTRTLRSQREEWIEEARGAKRDRNDMKYLHERTATSETKGTRRGSTDSADDVGENGPNDDDLYSLPTGRAAPGAKQTNKQASGNRDVEHNPDALFLGGMMDDSDEEMENFEFEDLDALIEAERQKAVSRNGANGKTVEVSGPSGDDFEDDIEAMEAMAGAQDGGSMKTLALAGSDEFADEMEAMDVMDQNSLGSG
jgi:replication fork protection complex subunit Csm3/Swi3